MRRVLEHPGAVVFDDVLTEDAWSEVWSYLQFEQLAPVTRTEGAWDLQDGQPFAGPEVTWRKKTLKRRQPGDYPTQTPADHVLEALAGLAKSVAPWVGTRWQRIVGRAYVYPSGTGLSWHRDDHALYSGAFVYYVHPEWSAQYGGELLVADTSDAAALPLKPFRFDHRDFDAAMSEQPGCGTFIAPRPNRLVILGGHPHMVNPVRPAAGNRVRASLAGFFVRREIAR